MPIHKIEITDTNVILWKAANRAITVLYTQLSGTTNAEKAADLETRLQNFFDVRIRRTLLPNDDPDRGGINSPTERLFQDGQDIIHRPVIITVTWPELDSRPNVAIRRARDIAI